MLKLTHVKVLASCIGYLRASAVGGMMQAEIEYLQRRAAAEVELAQRAASRAAVRAHYEMSKAYLDRVDQLLGSGARPALAA